MTTKVVSESPGIPHDFTRQYSTEQKDYVAPLSTKTLFEFYSTLSKLNEVVKFFVEHKELANVIEEEGESFVMKQIPTVTQPCFEQLVKSIKSSLAELVK